MTDEEINDLAKRIYRGEVFTSDQVRRPDDVGMVFMPLLLMDDAQRARLQADKPAMFWAPMADAGPRSINGYPCFFSLHYVTQEDRAKLWGRVKEIQELLGDNPKKEEP